MITPDFYVLNYLIIITQKDTVVQLHCSIKLNNSHTFRTPCSVNIAYLLTKHTISKKELHQIKQEVKEKELAKLRWQWFKAYRKLRNVKAVCRLYGITRSRFYYWKKRLDPGSGSGKRLTTKGRVI